MKRYAVIFAVSTLCGCTSHLDMQGNDPQAYYDAHPIKNTVEQRELAENLRLTPSGLSNEEFDRLHAALRDISPEAVDSIYIRVASSDMRTRLTRSMHAMGYGRDKLHFDVSNNMPRDTAHIEVHYVAVVAPRCPDWRTSPVTSYSNTHQGNFECASQVNFGLMVADPHDIVRGTGDVAPDTQRSAAVLSDYHGGKDFSKGGQKGATSGGSGSGEANGDPASGATSAISAGVSGMKPQ